MVEKSKLIKKPWLIVVALFTVLFTLSFGGMVFADGPGTTGGKWIQTEVKGIFTGLIAVLAVFALAKREFGSLAKIAIIGIVVALLIWSPEILNTSGVKWAKELFGV